MKIERLRLADNGLVEVHGGGSMCWYEDYEELQRQLDAARQDIRKLRESELKLATALRDLQDAAIDETIKRLSK